ncbi:MAG: hypothetical protein GY913_31075 [Proteobacteria bacterium]|nr:hypothetical protein [Pseudomonadota bacterium]
MMNKPARWMRDSVAAGGEFHWTKMDPVKHNLINIGSAVLVWAAIVGILALGKTAFAPVYLPIAGALVGCLFFGHFILIIHECSHNMFVLTANRDLQKKLNRGIGIVASAAFFTDYLKHWEKGHTTHHLHPCEDDDPQDRDPETGWTIYKKYLKLLLIPLYAALINPSNQYGFSPTRILGGLAFWVPSFVLGYMLVGWTLPVTMLIGFHVLSALNVTKKAQEHGCGLKFEEFRILRSRTYFYPTALLMSPFNINYHFEHHANFNVPWYKLPEYHQKLKSVMPVELQPYYFHSDYLQQLNGDKPLPPDELRPLTWDTSEAA